MWQGSRVTKKLQHMQGAWTLVTGQFKLDCLENDFFLSSEDTDVGLSLIRQSANLLIVAAVAFSTYAQSYNRLFWFKMAIGRQQEAQLYKTNAG